MMKDARTVSPVVSILLLVLISVSSSIVIYYVVHNYLGAAKRSGVTGYSPIIIEEAEPVEAGGGNIYSIVIVVRNLGGSEVSVPRDSLYILEGGALKAKGEALLFGSNEAKIMPRDSLNVTYFIDRPLPPGNYRIVLRSRGGGEALVRLSVKHPIMKSVFLKVYITNDSGHIAVYEDRYAIYKAWVEETGGNYKVYFRIYAKNGVWINFARAELFSKNGAHPRYVGGNPWYWNTPYTYPNYSGAEWTPVLPGEMPVTIIFSIKPKLT